MTLLVVIWETMKDQLRSLDQAFQVISDCCTCFTVKKLIQAERKLREQKLKAEMERKKKEREDCPSAHLFGHSSAVVRMSWF